MKKLIAIIILALALLAGCDTLNSFFCQPTEQQTLAANVGLALAQAALTAASVYSGDSTVASLSSLAIPTFKKVVEGYCSTNAEWQAAVTVLQQAQTAKVGLMAKAPNGDAINYLKAVKWAK